MLFAAVDGPDLLQPVAVDLRLGPRHVRPLPAHLRWGHSFKRSRSRPSRLGLSVARPSPAGYLLVYSETTKPDLGGEFWCLQLQHLQKGLFLYAARLPKHVCSLCSLCS